MNSYQSLKECPSCGRLVKKLSKHMKYHHPEDFIKMSFHGKGGATHPSIVEFRESLPKMTMEAKTN